jgi:predicted Zn-dependent protease
MVDAKTIELDCEAWLNGVKDILPVARLAKFTPQYKEFYSKVQENQGKVVNVDDYFSGLELPLKDKSVEEIVDNIEKREEASRKETEEYNKNNPVQEEAKPRLSEPYQVKVFDLQSSVLADKLKSILEKENKVENLKDNTQVEMTSIEQAEIGDREQLRADLKEQKGEICDNAKARSQNMKIDLIIAERSQDNLSKRQDGNLVEQHTDTNVNQIAMQAIGKLISR